MYRGKSSPGTHAPARRLRGSYAAWRDLPHSPRLLSDPCSRVAAAVLTRIPVWPAQLHHPGGLLPEGERWL